MNNRTVCTSITATLCATLAFASTQAIAAKSGGGGSTACTAAVDFPAFAYWKPGGKTMEILVADATGKCVRSVISSSGTGGTIQFSYPVSGTTNRGRVVWVAAPAVVSVDFTVDDLTKQITVFAKKTIYSGTGGFISLSKNGNALYSTRYLSAGGLVIDRLELDAVGEPIPNTTSAVFVAPDGSNVQTISVNSAETVLFADYKPISGASPIYQLVYVLLPGGSITATSVLDFNNSSRELNPAVDPWSLSNRVAYQRVAATAGSCDLLVTSSDLDPAPVYPLQSAYGMKPTWLKGKILADGRVASTRNGCDYTGIIMETDPVSGVQTALTSGYDPDGK